MPLQILARGKYLVVPATERALLMKIQALDIQIGDRIVAYCNSKMQTCTVQRVMESNQDNITLKVYTSMHYRGTASYTIRFNRDAFIDLAG